MRPVAMRFPPNCSIVPVSHPDRGRGLMNGGSQLIAAVTVKAGALILAEIERLDRADGIKVEAE